jgi:hypothetical protein
MSNHGMFVDVLALALAFSFVPHGLVLIWAREPSYAVQS